MKQREVLTTDFPDGTDGEGSGEKLGDGATIRGKSGTSNHEPRKPERGLAGWTEDVGPGNDPHFRLHNSSFLPAPPCITMPEMPGLNLKPTHKAVIAYYDSLTKFASLGTKNESAVRSAFQVLLDHCAHQFDWKLVPEYAIQRKGQADAKADGALLDKYRLKNGIITPVGESFG